MDLEAGRLRRSWKCHSGPGRTKVQVLQALHPLSSQDDLKFQWPLVVDSLPLCTAVFTRDAIEIQAPVHPTDLLTGLHEAKRRVYLTATLADDSVLVRDFGADPKSVETPIFPAGAGDIGDRMILVPQSLTLKTEGRSHLLVNAGSDGVRRAHRPRSSC